MTSTSKDRASVRASVVRFAAMVVILVAAFLVFRNSSLSEHLRIDNLTAAVDEIRALWWAPLALVVLWIVMSPLGLPASPLLLAGAVIFGVWRGTLYNCIGALAGATATYYFARYFGGDLIVHLLGEERILRVERRLEQYGFKALVGVRFLPLPWPVVNFGAALAGFRYGPFLLATAIGAVPIIFIYTLFYSSLIGATLEEGRTALISFLVALAVLVVLVVMRVLLRRRAANGPESDGADAS